MKAAQITCPLCGQPFVRGKCEVAAVPAGDGGSKVVARCLRRTEGQEYTCTGLLGSPILEAARELGNREGRRIMSCRVRRVLVED